MKKIISLVLVLALGLASVCLAVEDKWTKKADMPTERLGLSTSMVNGKIYAIGGGNSIEGSAFRTVEEYDPVTDTWTKKADMPTRRYFHSASVVNGKVYVVGGAIGEMVTTPTVEEHDPATGTWTRKADMPIARCFLSTSVVNGKIYAIGGRLYPGDLSVSTVEEYDPATDTWTTKADMPTPRCGLSASVIEGKIYAIGGIFGSLFGRGLSTVEEYDPTTDTWTTKADMSTARKWLSTSVVDGKLYAVGGGIYTGPVFSMVEEYDPTTDTWTTKADMPTARWFFSTSAVNGKIYAIGGSVQFPPHVSISTVEEYDTGLSAPSPDFNGDGTVDIKDLLRLIQSWGQDDPMVDIAPPFGDGVVDVLDLELLMSYWGQPVDDPTLIAHWKLDETEGIIAQDSAGEQHGTLYGEPLWQPTAGQIDGALQFDGIGDYVSTDFVLNPTDGSFSVFAWVKGGAPGQVVISQADGADWLSADLSDGKLMTGLTPPAGRTVPPPLVSEFVITDDEWHRVGFVWDGSYRTLYVDDVEVAKDAQDGLESATAGLYIGTGKAMEAGTHWSGLIDDVRIYNKAVKP